MHFAPCNVFWDSAYRWIRLLYTIARATETTYSQFFCPCFGLCDFYCLSLDLLNLPFITSILLCVFGLANPSFYHVHSSVSLTHLSLLLTLISQLQSSQFSQNFCTPFVIPHSLPIRVFVIVACFIMFCDFGLFLRLGLTVQLRLPGNSYALSSDSKELKVWACASASGCHSHINFFCCLRLCFF